MRKAARIHMSREVSQIQIDDRLTIKTTTGNIYELKVTKISNGEIVGISKEDTHQVRHSGSLISEMYPVQIKDDLKIYTRKGEVIEIVILNLENNHLLGHSPERVNYQISLADIERMEKKEMAPEAKGGIIVGGAVVVGIIIWVSNQILTLYE